MSSPRSLPSPAAATRRRPAAARGFTLIELLIAIVVLGILAAVAYPSYLDSIRKSRRSEAFTALSQVQQAQERWRGNNAAYASELGNTAAAGDPPNGLQLNASTPGGYYTLSIDSADATGYTITAVGQDGTSQADDAQCRTLGVRMAGGNLSYAGCGSGDCSYAATNPCWAK